MDEIKFIGWFILMAAFWAVGMVLRGLYDKFRFGREAYQDEWTRRKHG
jgi:hypothetical protein